MSQSLLIHLGLFLALTMAVVGVSCMFSEADDGDALRLFPRRYGSFLFWSAIVAGLMLVFEHTFASIH